MFQNCGRGRSRIAFVTPAYGRTEHGPRGHTRARSYAVEDVADPVKVDAGFASYQSKVEVEGSKVRYSREFVRRDVLIGPEHTEELRKFRGTIGADEAAVVVLKRAP